MVYPAIHSANYQLTHAEDLQREEEAAAKDEQLQLQLIQHVNTLWKLGDKGWINVWKDYWFSGIEELLSELQRLGYHVYFLKDYNPMTEIIDEKYVIYLKEQTDIGVREWRK